MVPNFRAYIKSINKIVDVTKIDLRNKMVTLDIATNKVNPNFSFWWKETELPFADVTLMQSTGLKDKNGVEIFEGDILTDEGSFGFDFWDYGEVVFDKDEYTYLIEWKSENVCESITNCGDYSIASNIYENKE